MTKSACPISLSIAFLFLASACTSEPQTIDLQASGSFPSPSPEKPEPLPNTQKPQSQVASLEEAISAGTAAKTLAQTAMSQDDWKLAVYQWQKAIELLKTVPRTSADYAQSQKTLKEYQANLAIAQKHSKAPSAVSTRSDQPEKQIGGKPLISESRGRLSTATDCPPVFNYNNSPHAKAVCNFREGSFGVWLDKRHVTPDSVMGACKWHTTNFYRVDFKDFLDYSCDTSPGPGVAPFIRN